MIRHIVVIDATHASSESRGKCASNCDCLTVANIKWTTGQFHRLNCVSQSVAVVQKRSTPTLALILGNNLCFENYGIVDESSATTCFEVLYLAAT